MKRLLSMLLIVLLAACSSNQIKVNQIENAIQNVLIDTVPVSYGLPFSVEECDSESGYCVNQVADDKLPSIDRNIYGEVLVQNESYFIHRKETQIKNDKGYFITQYEYFYNNYATSKLLYTCEKDDISKIIYDNENTYFYYVKDNEVVINKIEEGKLVEIEKRTVELDGYTFDSVILHNGTYIIIYESENNVQYLWNDNIFEFGKYDEIILLDNYIFVSAKEKGSFTTSYVINLETNEKVECNKTLNVDFVLSEGNQFLYIDEQTYHLARIDTNEIRIYNLEIEYSQDHLWGLGIMKNDSNDIIFMIENGSDININLVQVTK